jgi:hypothetical protein
MPAFSTSGWVTSAIANYGKGCSTNDLAWVNPVWLAPLTRLRLAEAAIDSAQLRTHS